MEHKKDKDDAILTHSTKDHPKTFPTTPATINLFIESSVTMSNIKKKDI